MRRNFLLKYFFLLQLFNLKSFTGPLSICIESKVQILFWATLLCLTGAGLRFKLRRERRAAVVELATQHAQSKRDGEGARGVVEILSRRHSGRRGAMGNRNGVTGHVAQAELLKLQKAVSEPCVLQLIFVEQPVPLALSFCLTVSLGPFFRPVTEPSSSPWL